MRIVRNSIFETNSSSTHSLTMCKKSEYESWKKGEMYYHICDDKLMTPEEADMSLRKSFIIYQASENRAGQEGYEYGGVLVDYKDMDKLFTEENLASVTEENIQFIRDNEDCEFDETDIPLSFADYESYIENSDYIEDSFVDELDGVVAFGYYGGQ